MSKLTPQKEKIIEEYYKNPKYGLSSAAKLYEVLKAKNLTWNINNISKYNYLYCYYNYICY